MNPELIRNFSIIAHVDHGKSTLADRLLQLTHTVAERDMQEQLLDNMDLERERGVTIKASAVRMRYQASDGRDYLINLIDTPGHVDFSYEVSRALQACEGAVLVVDASQGIEAQTLTNVYLALEQDLEILTVINKVDLPAARPDDVARELQELLGTPTEEMLRISAKSGAGVQDVLEKVIADVPPPPGLQDAPLRALVFDSHYDSYKGVIAYVRIVDGRLGQREQLQLMATGSRFEPVETGVFNPAMQVMDGLAAGEVGYIATGLKDPAGMSRRRHSHHRPERRGGGPARLSSRPNPWSSRAFTPSTTKTMAILRDALEKLQLNDAALSYEPETSQALNFGFPRRFPWPVSYGNRAGAARARV